ncbi:hypothetical protein EK904_014024 [Melospiza melodia maxima]|nr:hypothetical protein EK904_014024 [Melospiza melodia maxima]
MNIWQSHTSNPGLGISPLLLPQPSPNRICKRSRTMQGNGTSLHISLHWTFFPGAWHQSPNEVINLEECSGLMLALVPEGSVPFQAALQPGLSQAQAPTAGLLMVQGLPKQRSM